MDEIKIEEGLYGADLLACLWRKKGDPNFDPQLLSLLQKLCRKDLLIEEETESEYGFSAAETETLLTTDITAVCSNKEITARWCDYVQATEKRPAYLKQAGLAYFEIYNVTKTHAYAVRGLQLIRKAAGLFRNEMPSLYEQSVAIIRESAAPYWTKQLLAQLVPLFGENCRRDLSAFFEEKAGTMATGGHYEDARHYTDALQLIGALDKTACRRRRSALFESEGDRLRRKKPENTFYPAVSKRYFEALTEIRSLPDSEGQRQRLEGKVAAAQAEYYDFVRRAGVPLTPPVDHKRVQELLAELAIDGFESAYTHLIQLPVVPEDTVTGYVDALKKGGSFLTELFPESVRLDERGANVSTATDDEVLINTARRFARDRTIAFLRGLKNWMDLHKRLDKTFVFGLVERSKSRFIPEDRTYVFAEGLGEGFQNNFLAAAHLLVPQLENSFRYIASQNGLQTTKWLSEPQHQKMFKRCLEEIEDFTDPDLYKELHHFFADGDANFRNEICHGLLTPLLIDYYGSYVWWLMLKLVFQTEHCFSFPKE